jgi:hypothetical protein
MPIIFEHDFDPQTITELEELRSVRLGLAERQLNEVEKTASSLQSQGLDASCDDHLFMTGLRNELEGKISLLKDRINQRGVFYTDEVMFYLSIADETLPA